MVRHLSDGLPAACHLHPDRWIASPSVTDPGSVIDWLVDSDPSIRWQVMRDLLDTPESELVDRRRVDARQDALSVAAEASQLFR
jgi:hypothetical protein